MGNRALVKVKNMPRSDKGVMCLSDAEMIDRHSIPEPNSGCWLWLGSLNVWGYGRLGPQRRERQAHRLSYLTFKGPIPPGLLVLHSCDMACCVNPDHLRLGTVAENNHDAIERKRHRVLSGEQHSLSKLTFDVVTQIRSRKIEYGTVSSLAREFGVSRRNIRFVLEGKTWKR